MVGTEGDTYAVFDVWEAGSVGSSHKVLVVQPQTSLIICCCDSWGTGSGNPEPKKVWHDHGGSGQKTWDQSPKGVPDSRKGEK
jgi:hypothetical protein